MLDIIRDFGVLQSVIDSEILPHYEELYIEQTLKNCLMHFKTNQVSNKAGFFLSALQKGYYKNQIEIEQAKQNKKEQSKQQELFQRQSEIEQKSKQVEQLQKLREQYMDHDFVELILEQYE